MRASDPVLLRELLRDVSRSFYMTLRVLPAAVRRQIGAAYLLARASDTIADTDAVPMSERLHMLDAFSARVQGRGDQSLQIERLAGYQSSPAERVLLNRLNDAVALLDGFAPNDQALIRQVLNVITSGQRLDLERFSTARPDHVVALATEQQLDDYTYRVAGCVGEFWTRICRAHLFPAAPLDEAVLLSNAVRFGKGLQWVNVLRDVPADLRIGRCYLPEESLARAGLSASALLDPANEVRLRPLYSGWLDTAEHHLQAGWAYTNSLPRSQVRIRLACAWPILIGTQTIQKLRTTQILVPGRRVKVSRAEVRRILWRSVVYYPWPRRWGRLLEPSNRGCRNPLPDPASLAK